MYKIPENEVRPAVGSWQAAGELCADHVKKLDPATIRELDSLGEGGGRERAILRLGPIVMPDWTDTGPQTMSLRVLECHSELATISYVVALNSPVASGNPGVIVPIAALNCAIGAILGRVAAAAARRAQGRGHPGVPRGSGAHRRGELRLDGAERAPGLCLRVPGGVRMGLRGLHRRLWHRAHRLPYRHRHPPADRGRAVAAGRVPPLALAGGDVARVPELLGAAATDPEALVFLISGFFAMPAFSFWYKGNSMCGTALGMACNGMYAFWGPLFIWVIMGVLGIGGMAADYPPLTAAQWIGAIIMVAGIFCIAVNPAELLGGKGKKGVRDAR